MPVFESQGCLDSGTVHRLGEHGHKLLDLVGDLAAIMWGIMLGVLLGTLTFLLIYQ